MQVDEDEHFIVWMRVAALPNFRKLWGKVETDLRQGDVITVSLQNRYNTYSFDGQKKLVRMRPMPSVSGLLLSSLLYSCVGPSLSWTFWKTVICTEL
jgi:hypothetical protein